MLRREAVTGLCLEALLGEKFRHPNVVATLAWAVVTGKVSCLRWELLVGLRKDAGKHMVGVPSAPAFSACRVSFAVQVLHCTLLSHAIDQAACCLFAIVCYLNKSFLASGLLLQTVLLIAVVQSKMAAGKRLWGETLDEGRPSIAENKAAVAAANGGAAQQQVQPALNRLSSGASSARDSMDHAGPSVSQQLPSLGEDEETNSSNYSSSSLVTAETWLVLEYANKGEGQGEFVVEYPAASCITPVLLPHPLFVCCQQAMSHARIVAIEHR